MYDWNDLRAYIAVAESGSTLAAARALKVSQTTVARRIAALEEALGLTLFEKRQAGYALTPMGETLLPKARAVEGEADRFAEAASAQQRDVSGIVRLTVMEIFAITILAPILRDLHDAHPAIRIELDTSDDVRDLSTGAADIALRAAKEAKGGALVCRRLAPSPWTLYCSRDYAERHGAPHSRAELALHQFIGGGGSVWPPYRNWLQQIGLEESVIMHHDSAAGLLSGVRSGMGLAVLPVLVADHEPDLIQLIPPIADDSTSLWLMTHERLRHVPRIRAVLDFIAPRVKALEPI